MALWRPGFQPPSGWHCGRCNVDSIPLTGQIRAAIRLMSSGSGRSFRREFSNRYIMKRKKDYINLLPPEKKKAKRTFSRITIGAGLFILAWLVVFGWQAKHISDLRSSERSLAAKKQTLQQQLAFMYQDFGIALPAGTSPEKAWLIQNLLSERVLWSEVFKQFSLIVPRGLWFDNLEGSAAGKAEIKIRGGALTYRTVSEFMQAMEKSPYFEKPQLIFAQKTALQGQEVIGFEIVSGVKKMKGTQ